MSAGSAGQDLQFACAGFFKRDQLGNPFCQIYVIALRNENFPLYSRPIPIPPSLYGATAAINREHRGHAWL